MAYRKMYRILWPEEGYVLPARIRTWHSDAVANGEVDRPDHRLTTDEMARNLHIAGCITLGR